MLYLIIGLVLIVVVFLVGLFFISRSEGEEYLSKAAEEDHVDYHKEKYQKIKDQYYRGVDLEKLNQHFDQDIKIVGIAKPQGKWSSMVIKRNMQYMTTLKNLMGTNFSKMGIWQLKIKAQSLISHGMHKGRGK